MIKVFIYSLFTYWFLYIALWIIENKLNIVFSRWEAFFITMSLFTAMTFHRATFNASDKLEEKEKE